MTIQPLNSSRQPSPFFQSGVICRPDGKRMLRYAYPTSLVVLPDERLFCCFFGLPAEGPGYSGCYGCFSEDDGINWSEPQLLIGRDGSHVHADPNVVIDDRRVMVFSTSYRYANNVHDLSRSWTWKIVSNDSGRTWSKPVEMPQPHRYMSGKVTAGIRLSDGTLVMGYSWDQVAERGGRAGGESAMDCCAGVLRSADGGETWSPGGDLHVEADNPQGLRGADEPALVLLGDGSLYALIRTFTDRLWESRSRDGGLTWDAPQASALVSSNCPAELLRLNGQPDTVMALYDNNPTGNRRPLCVAYSMDGCRRWSDPKIIAEVPEGWHAAYPVARETSKGTIVVAWYQGRAETDIPPEELFHIRCARFNREWLLDSCPK